MADILEEIVAHKRIEIEQRKRFIQPLEGDLRLNSAMIPVSEFISASFMLPPGTRPPSYAYHVPVHIPSDEKLH